MREDDFLVGYNAGFKSMHITVRIKLLRNHCDVNNNMSSVVHDLGSLVGK